MSIGTDYRFMRGKGEASRAHALGWALTRVVTAHRTKHGRVSFMGRVSGNLWWDIQWRGGWLVLSAGRFTRNGVLSLRGLRRPTLFWSPNGTGWHHDARNILGHKADRECVCDECSVTAQGQEDQR